MTYTDLYRQRSDLKRMALRIKYKRERWKEFVDLSTQVREITVELKRLSK